MDISLGISIIALVVAGYSLLESRKSNRLNQKPALTGHESTETNCYLYIVSNQGNGPAFFENVDYFLNKQLLEKDNVRSVVDETLSKNNIRAINSIMLIGDHIVLAPGSSLTVAEIIFPPEDKDKFENMPNIEFGLRIKYKSAFGESDVWATDNELKEI